MALPFSPCLPALPKAYISTRKLSGIKATITYKPPYLFIYELILKSVPLPAKFVLKII